MNEKIEKEINNFVLVLENKNKKEKRLYHYQSVLNISHGLMKLSNANNHHAFKELILEYFSLIKKLDYLVSQKESLIYYKKYILPIGKHLIENNGFRTKADIFKYVSIGLAFDLALFQFFTNKFYPIFILIFYLIGYIKQKEKIKKNKLFSIHW